MRGGAYVEAVIRAVAGIARINFIIICANNDTTGINAFDNTTARSDNTNT